MSTCISVVTEKVIHYKHVQAAKQVCETFSVTVFVCSLWIFAQKK